MLLFLCWVLHGRVGLESRLLLLVDPGVGFCSSVRLLVCRSVGVWSRWRLLSGDVFRDVVGVCLL